MRNIIISTIFICILALSISCNHNGTSPEKNNLIDEILFIRYHESLSQLCSIRPDGTDFSIISELNVVSMDFSAYVMAAWSPGKEYIALVGGPIEYQDTTPLWLVSNNGIFMELLSWGGWHPVWYDENNLFYIQSKNPAAQPTDLYRLNISTSEYTLIYEDTLYNGWGNFFDQNNWIALDWQDDHQEIVLLNVETGNREYLTNTPNIDEFQGAKLSPDKTKVLYLAKYNVSFSPRNLFWFDMSDKIPNQLTFFEGFNLHQAEFYVWSPNSDKVAFSNPNPMTTGTSGWTYYSDIFIIDIYTGEIDTLTHTAADSITNLVVDWK